MSENLQARTELESTQAESSRAAKDMVIVFFISLNYYYNNRFNYNLFLLPE